MNLEAIIKDSLVKFKEEAVAVLLFSLVGIILSLTIVLIPAVAAGMAIGFLKYVRDGVKPELSELWSHFDKYIQTLLFLIVAGLLTSVGFMLLVIPGVILSAIWMYSIFFIVDRDMNFRDAMEASRKSVSSGGFGLNLVLAVILILLSALGNALGGIGFIVTLPIAYLLLARAYGEVAVDTGSPRAAATIPGNY